MFFKSEKIKSSKAIRFYLTVNPAQAANRSESFKNEQTIILRSKKIFPLNLTIKEKRQ